MLMYIVIHNIHYILIKQLFRKGNFVIVSHEALKVLHLLDVVGLSYFINCKTSNWFVCVCVCVCVCVHVCVCYLLVINAKSGLHETHSLYMVWEMGNSLYNHRKRNTWEVENMFYSIPVALKI